MVAIVLSLVAAAMNALASVCQRRAGQDEPDQHGTTLRMMLDLVRRPVWLAGIAAMVAGFGLEAAALTLGRIALVEPLMIVELPLTLLGAAWAFQGRLDRWAWLAIAGLAAGVAAFVFALSPDGGDPGAVPLWQWLVAGGITVGVAVVFLVLGWRMRRPRAAFWGISTGTTFGLMSALIAGAGAAYAHGGFGLLFTSWQTYAAVIVGPTSFFLLQNALQAGSLVASQPGFTLLNPLAAVFWGVLVFGETVRGGAWLALAAVAAVVVTAATLLLVRVADHGSADGAEDGNAENDGAEDDGAEVDGARNDEPDREGDRDPAVARRA